MTKRLPMVFADKVDKAIQWEKNNWINNWVHFHWLTNPKRRAWAEFSSGVLSLLSVIWFFFLGRGRPETAWGIITVAACYLTILGIYDYRQSKRKSPLIEEGIEPASTADTKELTARTSSESALPPHESVTESTTLHLKAKLKRPKESL